MENLILLITKYGYFILFPLAIVEGPTITIIAGLLVFLGILNIFLVYIILLAGDIIGDSLMYLIGRLSSSVFFKWIGSRFGVTDSKVERIKKYFSKHGNKAIALSKYIHGIGIVGLITAGSLKLSYRRYILTCFVATLIQSAILLTVGILFGHAYAQLSKYLNYYGAATIIGGLIIAVIFVIRKLKLFSE